MDIYKQDSEEFTPEWIAYLASLESEVFRNDQGTCVRITKDPQGRVVRVERWYPETTAGNVTHRFPVFAYEDHHLPGWMEP